MSELPPTPASSNSERIYTSSLSVQNKKRVEWSPENEKILVEWCDIAQCYKWLNTRSHSKYSKSHAYFTIPAIVLSTITGTASFAQSSLSGATREYAPMVIGSINIAIGILTTLQQYLKISELNEAHRVASIAWDKFARNIRIEIAKAPDERPDAGLFLKYNRDEYDRLMETSPSIPDDIIRAFVSTFSVEAQTDPERKRQFKQLKRPDICDVIISAEENRHHWYKDLLNPAATNEPSDFEERFGNDLLKLQEQLRGKELELIQKESAMEIKVQRELEDKEKKRIELDAKRIELDAKLNQAFKNMDAYTKMFVNSHGRDPVEDEIRQHFASSDEVGFISEFMQRYADERV